MVKADGTVKLMVIACTTICWSSVSTRAVVHLICRDRNRIGLQGGVDDKAGAQAVCGEVLAGEGAPGITAVNLVYRRDVRAAARVIAGIA